MTENALLEALRKAKRPKSGGEGMQVTEIRRATGMSVEKVRDLIRAGLQNGSIRRAERSIERLDGIFTTVTTYALVAKKK